jgi:hypothetical protein
VTIINGGGNKMVVIILIAEVYESYGEKIIK